MGLHAHFMWHSSAQEQELSREDIWSRAPSLLDELRRSEPFTLRAFVLMGNHFHGLAEISCPAEEFGEKMTGFFLSRFDLDPARFALTAISDFKHYLTTYKYIYRNPVEAGCVRQVQDYEYSTIGEQLGTRLPRFQTVDNMNLIQDQRRVLGWLNNRNELFYPTRNFESA